MTVTADDAETGARLPTVDLLGVRIHALTEAQVVAHIMDSIDAGRGGFVVTPNIDHMRRCVDNSDYRETVASADLVLADGVPLVWASRVAGDPLPEQVAGSNLIVSLPAAAAARGISIFLLGGAEGTAAGAAMALIQRFPGLRVAGTWCPPFGFEDSPEELARLEAAVVGASPDIVFVGLGSPKQERLIERLRGLLPRTWWLGVGISFSYVTGDVRRAPVWMRRMGVEWVHRVASEPGRLARRYLIEGIPFGVRLMSWAAWRRFRRRTEPSGRRDSMR